MRLSRPAALLLAALLSSPSLHAQAPDPSTETATPVTLATVTVSGVLPGPGLWKVSKDGHVLWLLGTLRPLPKNMEWESLQVERVLANSQEFITSGGLSITSDIGWFRGLMLVPKALKARKNPDDKTLQELLPAPLYARWAVLKKTWLGNDRSVERWRPMFAAQELYSTALKKNGLRGGDQIVSKLVKLAKKQDITVTSPMVSMKIKDPKAALNTFNETRLDDIACFEKTMARIETDLPAMKARANAWAIGEMAAIRALPYEDQRDSCESAVLENQLAKQLGLVDVEAKVYAAWRKAIDTALEKNTSTLAVMSIAELLKPDGELARLQAMGYTVEPPQ